MIEDAPHDAKHEESGDPVADRGESQQPGEPDERFEQGFEI
jgi:hypothetical protein